jgi:hypothetical protein
MKHLLSILIVLCAAALPAQTVTLAWDASPSPGVVGYHVYYGTNSRSYSFVTNAGLVRTQAVVLPHTGRWFFAATVSDTIGMESEFSNEVEWEAKPSAPVMQGEAWVRLSPVIERSTNQVDWVTTTGAPTFFAATNGAEFFATRRLVIEQVQRVITP